MGCAALHARVMSSMLGRWDTDRGRRAHHGREAGELTQVSADGAFTLHRAATLVGCHTLRCQPWGGSDGTVIGNICLLAGPGVAGQGAQPHQW